jgi:mannose-1-phosphate guanylyltransferase / phosphomannomutase
MNDQPFDAVFLDRDGVINEEVNLLHSVDQLRLIPGTASGIRRLNEAGLPVFVVTNQPVVARGICTEDDIRTIHRALETLLAAEGARVNDIEFCPHHENADLPSYRRDCPDRKPGIGMLLRLAERHGVDLRRCVIVGDRTTDVQAGLSAGCRTILVLTGYAGEDGKHDVSPDATCADLAEAVDWILRGESLACAKP